MHAPQVVLNFREEAVLQAVALGYQDIDAMVREITPARIRMHLALARFEEQQRKLEVEHFSFPMRFGPSRLN